MFMWKLSRPPLLVGGELRQLRKLEAMADVKAVNLLVPDMWSRLWANSFLLRKAQYFQTHTYEARLNTPLRGEWDLLGGLIAIELPAEARRPISPRFSIVDTRHPAFVRVAPADGWHPEEFDPASGAYWQWTKGNATWTVENPHDHALTLDCAIDGGSAVPRAIALQVANDEPTPPVGMGTERTMIQFSAVRVPPGRSTLTLQSQTPPTVVPGDPRPLGVSVHRLHITPRR
jgi:hypothetical protein